VAGRGRDTALEQGNAACLRLSSSTLHLRGRNPTHYLFGLGYLDTQYAGAWHSLTTCATLTTLTTRAKNDVKSIMTIPSSCLSPTFQYQLRSIVVLCLGPFRGAS
jgi:hypothetical protein